jgi:hypothetical protein
MLTNGARHLTKKLPKSRDGVVEYKKGDLVQIQNASLETASSDAKFRLTWGTPHRVVDFIRNS